MVGVPDFLREPAFWVGGYGAVVATVVAVLRFVEFRRDRQAVRIRGVVQPHVSGKAELPPDAFVYVTNVGRRVVHLREIGVVLGNGSRVPCPSDIGVNPRLNEGEEVGVSASVEDVFQEGARTVYAGDTRSQSWMMPKRAYRAFRTAYRAAVTESENQRQRQMRLDARKWLGEMKRDVEGEHGP